MNMIRAYFSSPHDFHRVLLLTFSISFFWIIEHFKGLNFNYKKLNHALKNSLFVFTAAPVQMLLGFLLIKTIDWDDFHHFGFLQLFHGLKNPWAMFFISIIFLDFFEYVYHVLMHKIKKLWMFHLVHHSDPVVDVSTTLREHPGETFVRLTASVLWVYLLGAPFWIILFRQFIQISANVFVHSNFRLNEKVDRFVGMIFITPNLHHVHHHYKQPYTDSNYGDILSIWDHLFKTFRRLGANETTFGIDTCMNEEENSGFKNLLKIPFESYRPPGSPE